MIDCEDGSDEMECQTLTTTTTVSPKVRSQTCSPYFFECSGICIPNKWKCDGELDCPKGQDESNCDISTTLSPSTTIDLTSISTSTTSPGTATATDSTLPMTPVEIPSIASTTPVPVPTTTTASLISRPQPLPPKTCNDDEFRCASFLGGFCIPNRFRCDGDEDCVGAEDETGCTFDSVTLRTTTLPSTPSTTLPSWYFNPSSSYINPRSSTSASRPTVTCSEDEFRCPSFVGGFCIPHHFKCDGDEDCIAGEDERECDEVTTSTETTMPSLLKVSTTSTTSTLSTLATSPIPSANSLIFSPPGKCDEHQFLCPSNHGGFCIPSYFRCDKDSDCLYGEDEVGCEEVLVTRPSQLGMVLFNSISSLVTSGTLPSFPRKPVPCERREFFCPSVLGGYCIPSHFICDGDLDCLSGEDERNCRNKNCTESQFRCPGISPGATGLCIPKIYKCDGTRDCQFGEDEEGCDDDENLIIPNSPSSTSGALPERVSTVEPKLKPCGVNEFKCLGSGNCIPKVKGYSKWKCFAVIHLIHFIVFYVFRKK